MDKKSNKSKVVQVEESRAAKMAIDANQTVRGAFVNWCEALGYDWNDIATEKKFMDLSGKLDIERRGRTNSKMLGILMDAGRLEIHVIGRDQ